MINEPNFDISMKIGFISQNCPVFTGDEITITEMAEFYGAIKCFKYLMLNYVDLLGNQNKYAISGGNVEIVRLLEQKNKCFDDCHEFAAYFHNNDIYRWLCEKNPPDMKKVLEASVSTNNVELLLDLQTMKLPIISVINRNEEASLLFSNFEGDINDYITEAVRSDSIRMVNHFLRFVNRQKIDINYVAVWATK